MKQIPGDKRCVAIVADMMFPDSPVNFEMSHSESPPYNDFLMANFAFINGSVMGVGFGADQTMSEDTIIEARFAVRGLKAYVVVDNNGNEHAVYWDGKKVHDPDSKVNGKKLEEYKILRFFPIFKLEE